MHHYTRVNDRVIGGSCGKRDHISQEMGHALLLGLVAYVTVATHAFHMHYQSGHHRALVLESRLPRRHPLRRLLLPTEIGTTNSIGRGVVSLLGEKRAFQSIFPFEYTGLEQMLSTYLPWDPSEVSDHHTALVMNGGSLHHVLGDYQRWWAYHYNVAHDLLRQKLSIQRPVHIDGSVARVGANNVEHVALSMSVSEVVLHLYVQKKDG
jgi:hypothetical protein